MVKSKAEWYLMVEESENGLPRKILQDQQQLWRELCSLLTIDAHENRDVMSADVPNAFIQTAMPEVKEGEERVMMKITGVLVGMLVQLDPQLYGPHIVYEKGRKVLYLQVRRAIY